MFPRADASIRPLRPRGNVDLIYCSNLSTVTLTGGSSMASR